MHLVKKLLTSERSYIFLLSIIILILSFSSLIYNIYITPKGTYFPLIHNHLLDFHLYIHYMRQAWEGNWLIISRYTPEDFPARFAYFVYIFLGKVARFFSLSLPVTYTLSRLAGSISFILLIYIFIKRIYPASKAQRIISFFLVLFGGGFWTISQTASSVKINTMLSYWTELDVIGRLTFVPHHLIAKVLMLASFLLLSSAVRKKSLKLLTFASITGFMTGFASPFVALNQEIILAIAFALTTLHLFFHKQTIKTNIIYIFVYMFFSGISLVYFRWLENAGYPWSVYLDWEKVSSLVTLAEYALFSGPNLILGLFAFIYFLRQRDFLHLLLISWFIESWLGIFFLAPFFPVQNIRFLAGAYFIPLGIIAGKGVINLTNYLCKFLKIKKIIIASIILFLTSAVFIGNIYANLKYQFSFFSNHFYNVYLAQELSDGFAYLDYNTPVNSVVLSQGYIANLIPAYSHNKTVHGHPTQTFKADEKGLEVTRFFTQDDIKFAADLLQKYKVSYVFYGQDTPVPHKSFTDALKLQKVYYNNLVAIYKVY